MEEEPNAAFWYGFQPADRDIHRPCLLTKRPCRSLDVPFNLKIYFVAYVHVKPLHTRNSSRFGYTSFSFGVPSVDFPLRLNVRSSASLLVFILVSAYNFGVSVTSTPSAIKGLPRSELEYTLPITLTIPYLSPTTSLMPSCTDLISEPEHMSFFVFFSKSIFVHLKVQNLM